MAVWGWHRDAELEQGLQEPGIPVAVLWDVEREGGSPCALLQGLGIQRGFPSVFPHEQMPCSAERMLARGQRSLEFHCFKIFINVKMSLALKPRQYSRSLFAGVEVSDAEKPLSCKYKLY